MNRPDSKGQRLVKTALGLFLSLSILCLCGCGPEVRLSRLDVADRVVVRQPNAQGNTSVVIQGDEVRQLVRAITQARRDGSRLGPDNGFAVLEFFHGTNELGVMQCGRGRFWINGLGYQGQTGELLKPGSGGPIHFRISNGFRGFIYFIRNPRSGSEISSSNGVYRLTIPADGIVSVRDVGLLYSWAASAQFIDGREIVLSPTAEPVGSLPSGEEAIKLFSLGAFSANGFAFCSYYVGTDHEYYMDRFANVAPSVFMP